MLLVAAVVCFSEFDDDDDDEEKLKNGNLIPPMIFLDMDELGAGLVASDADDSDIGDLLIDELDLFDVSCGTC